jgi:hypothetical protein
MSFLAIPVKMQCSLSVFSRINLFLLGNYLIMCLLYELKELKGLLISL